MRSRPGRSRLLSSAPLREADEWPITLARQVRYSFIARQRMRWTIAILTCTLTWNGAARAQGNTAGQQPSQPARAMRIRVSGGALGGLVDHEALPIYPDQALQSRTQGDVVFTILVGEGGKIISAGVVEGDPLLVAASTDALRDFRFRPYLLNGVPIQVESQLAFRFSVHGKGQSSRGEVEYVSSIPYRPEFRPGTVTAGGALILWPRKISGPEPQLPPDLEGQSGAVYLTITIGVDGKVQDVKVVGGDEPFIAPVVAAVKLFTSQNWSAASHRSRLPRLVITSADSTD